MNDNTTPNSSVLHAWQVWKDGAWGILAATNSTGTPFPLVGSSEDLIAGMENVAHDHHQRFDLPVRLARFALTDTISTLGNQP